MTSVFAFEASDAFVPIAVTLRACTIWQNQCRWHIWPLSLVCFLGVPHMFARVTYSTWLHKDPHLSNDRRIWEMLLRLTKSNINDSICIFLQRANLLSTCLFSQPWVVSKLFHWNGSQSHMWTIWEIKHTLPTLHTTTTGCICSPVFSSHVQSAPLNIYSDGTKSSKMITFSKWHAHSPNLLVVFINNCSVCLRAVKVYFKLKADASGWEKLCRHIQGLLLAKELWHSFRSG